MTEIRAETKSGRAMAKSSADPYAEIGHVWPLPPDEVAEITGTTEPTAAMLRQCRDQFMDLPIPRGEGRYVVSAEESGERTVFFFGWSGD